MSVNIQTTTQLGLNCEGPDDLSWPGSFLHRYEFIPGNHTRYDMLIGRDDAGQYILAWMNKAGSGGNILRWDGYYVHVSYLAEKMAPISWADADALCALLNQLSLPASMSDEMVELEPGFILHHPDSPPSLTPTLTPLEGGA
jgi:hypothetical protein